MALLTASLLQEESGTLHHEEALAQTATNRKKKKQERGILKQRNCKSDSMIQGNVHNEQINETARTLDRKKSKNCQF